MRRWLTRILICLAMGVVTTVGVAWGCALWSPASSLLYFREASPDAVAAWVTDSRLETVRSFRTLDIVGYRIEYFELWFNAPHLDTPIPRPLGDVDYSRYNAEFPVQFVVVYEAGWPLLAFGASAAALNPIVLESRFTQGVEPTGTLYVRSFCRIVPVIPKTVGFLIDTFFYAALWFGLLLGPGAARRNIRRRRGRCVKCGYDLRGSPDAGCSECGWGRAEAEE